MAILKKIEGNELHLYMNGHLIYKRWLDSGHSKVFDLMAYDKYTLTSIRDLEYENPNDLLPVKAKLRLKKTSEGGRLTGIKSGYRPNHVFEYNDKGQLLQTYIGDITFEGKPTIEPGEERIVTVRFLMNQPLERFLNKGCKWFIYEGPNLVGEAEII
jgi:hypothetical protein